MAKSILQVRGIGPAAAALLAEHGIKTAEDMAARHVAEVAAIKGFGENRAAQVIADAKALFEGADVPALEMEAPAARKKTAKKPEKVKSDKKSDVVDKPKKGKKEKPEKKKKEKKAKKSEKVKQEKKKNEKKKKDSKKSKKTGKKK